MKCHEANSDSEDLSPWLNRIESWLIGFGDLALESPYNKSWTGIPEFIRATIISSQYGVTMPGKGIIASFTSAVSIFVADQILL